MGKTAQAVTLVWFRRDLRVFDHTALAAAAGEGLPVVGVYVFDTDELKTYDADNRRVGFIYDTVAELQAALAKRGVPLWVLHGSSRKLLPEFAAKVCARAVIYAEDDESAALHRDNHIGLALEADGRKVLAVRDHAVYSRAQLMTQQGTPYSVYTAYKKAWLAAFACDFAAWQPHDPWDRLSEKQRLLPQAWQWPTMPEWHTLGFFRQPLPQKAGERAAQKQLGDFLKRLADYHLTRDFPAQKGTSGLSAYIACGALSVRHLAYLAFYADSEGAHAWLGELVWREFYRQFLFHHPHTENESWRAECRSLAWENCGDWLAAWQRGQTGYPIVDAAMRQLAATGMMHNRLRMITSAFLTKDLLVDWRLGAAWFARRLLDYDLASNCGNWQWAAGTGCDAQPYFRIFNPVAQSQKFDPDGTFIRRYVPELAHLDKHWIHAPWLAKNSVDTHGYPAPLVNHAEQREKITAIFQAAKRTP